jgi:hypothetical protein
MAEQRVATDDRSDISTERASWLNVLYLTRVPERIVLKTRVYYQCMRNAAM